VCIKWLIPAVQSLKQKRLTSIAALKDKLNLSV
jgi:uncharacterized protein YlxP (DUF503 family)